MMKLRRATRRDAPAIAAIIDTYVKRGELLPRSLEEIIEGPQDWMVAVAGGAVRACGSLVAYSSSLSELRSLAVAEGDIRNGLGTAVTEALIEEARSRGVRTLFALTRATPFFLKAGFRRSAKDQFPEKVWRDCRLCPIQEHCDEEAVVLHLGGAQRGPESVQNESWQGGRHVQVEYP